MEWIMLAAYAVTAVCCTAIICVTRQCFSREFVAQMQSPRGKPPAANPIGFTAKISKTVEEVLEEDD